MHSVAIYLKLDQQRFYRHRRCCSACVYHIANSMRKVKGKNEMMQIEFDDAIQQVSRADVLLLFLQTAFQSLRDDIGMFTGLDF